MQFEKEDAVSEFESLKSIEDLTEYGTKVKVTKNQLKVMENKYLRGDSVELWMRRISRNIALANLFYEDPSMKEKILEGVKYKLLCSDEDSKSQMLLLQLKDL